MKKLIFYIFFVQAILECLRTQVSGARLQKLGLSTFAEVFTSQDQTGDHLYVNNPWQPYVDGGLDIEDPFVPLLPEELIASGNYEKVPIMIGDNSEGGLLMMSQVFNNFNLEASCLSVKGPYPPTSLWAS